MTTPWWSGLAAVVLPIDCGGHPHRLQWAEGALTAIDHPDADRERMLAALGADPYACLDIVDVWDRYVDDLDVLVRASRGPADPVVPDDDDDVRHGRSGVMYRGGYQRLSASRPRPRLGGLNSGWFMGMGGDERSPRDGLTRLLTLGGGLSERLVANVIGTWIERGEAMDPRAAAAAPALKAALYGRFAAVVARWLVGPPPVELTVVGSDRTPTVTRQGAGLRAELPLSWLRDVWCRDLATVGGRLTLAAQDCGAGKWELVTITPDIGPPRRVTLQL